MCLLPAEQELSKMRIDNKRPISDSRFLFENIAFVFCLLIGQETVIVPHLNQYFL